MPTGVIKFFQPTRGFGFILRDDGQPDVFIHIKEAQKSGITELKQGDKVQFEVVQDARSGRNAAGNIALI